MKYVLTGATGGLGSRVFKHLLDLAPANDIIVSVYNPSGATKEILNSGVEVRKGDYSVPETLDEAFKGADKLLIVSYPSTAYEIRIKSHIAAIDAAKRSGVRHIYYTSLAFAGDSVAAVMHAHLDTEAYLKQCGVTYTIIREGIYSESFPLYFGFFDPKEGGDEVFIPFSDGAIAWVCRDDLGDGTARIMVSDHGYENTTVLLSGSKSISLTDISAKISNILPDNRKLSIRIVSEDEYVAHNISKQPESLLRSWSTTYKALARGELDVIDPLLQNLLGRDLKPFDETLKEMLTSGDGSAAETKQYAK